MKVNIKYKNPNVLTLFKELKKEYEVYINDNGFPVIDILNIEIPVFGFSKQPFELLYKVKANEEDILSTDRNGFYKIDIEIIADKDNAELITKAYNKKKKEQAKQANDLIKEKKAKKAEILKVAREKKKMKEEGVA